VSAINPNQTDKLLILTDTTNSLFQLVIIKFSNVEVYSFFINHYLVITTVFYFVEDIRRR
ncbi:MAG: hypothetical protein ACKPEQ_20435, partial [Dolichospermum sp.]